MKEIDIEKLENVKFTFDKEAFKAQEGHCEICNKKMERTRIEMDIQGSVLSVKLNVFRCKFCKKEYLNFEEAKKLDQALRLSRLMGSTSYKIKRALSFDGDNYIFRIPAEIAKNLGKKPSVDMIPISSKDFVIHLDKE